MIPFHEYLKKSKEILVNYNAIKCLHVIMGNESCDMDSMVSALSLAAFYVNHKYYGSDIHVIPLINCKEKDFSTKTECVYLLDKYKVDRNNLLFKDQIDLARLRMEDRLKITLVDHHVLVKEDRHLKDCVMEVIDHRPRDESETWGPNVQVRISPVASCSTLIADKIFEIYNKCLCTVAQLLYETIIYDSIALKPEAGKVTPLDHAMAERLEKLLKPSETRQETFDKSWAAHNDTSSLTTIQILNRDTKQLENIIICGVPTLVETFMQREDFEESLKQYSADVNVEVVIIMGMNAEGSLVRDLAIYKKNSLSECVKDVLLKSELELEEVEKNIGDLVYYKQNNAKLSRKYVLPLVKECDKK